MAKKAEELLCYIFEEILPEHGMSLRENQKELSLEMLRALIENKLALCEAEVGTGKTHAYILALTVYNLYAKTKASAVISTSTIALQKALTEEYIPQISNILLEHKIIEKPLTFVIRKGKKHYVCDTRLRTYESSIKNLDRELDQKLLIELKRLTGENENLLDLDNAILTPYVKGRINVLQCRESCPYAVLCRFMNFKKKCMLSGIDFQITNHNFILADLIGRKQGRKPLFPAYHAIVLDESHKLVDAARQMYSTFLEEQELERLLALANGKRVMGVRSMERLKQLSSHILKNSELLFERLGYGLSGNHTREGSRESFTVGLIEQIYIKNIIYGLEQMALLCKEDGGNRTRNVQRGCQNLIDKYNIFLNSNYFICWMEKRENGRLAMCVVPMELERILYEDIWNRAIPSILTSGTMSVRGDFTHFRRNTGINFAPDRRIMETSKESPFDYKNHGMLYIPERMPFPNIRDGKYMEILMEEIKKIINATHGHTLILFTSYWLMERVFYGLKEEISGYPLFMMGKGRLDVISNFRKSGNGVLFASDSAGEGIDLAGDILSSLIVVKLPFPVPDPVMEYQSRQYDDFELYKQDIIIPAMLIKLRQWMGRGIRRESDSAVFTILDSRASLCGKYREEILNALPSMPVTDRLVDVADFIIRKKADSYFEE